MTWTLLVALFVVLALAVAAACHRRADLALQREAVAERAAMAQRANEARPVQVPQVDLAKCLGCGTCVRACPEQGVLQLVHGQAAVVNGAACVGHAHCVAECPVGAVTLTQGDLTARRDVPVLDAELQAVGTPGLFLVGEITARSLIKPATVQGIQVMRTIGSQRRARPESRPGDRRLDAVIVGAGPGGLAAALAAREQGLSFVLLDQEPAIGGTVAKYPRRKLVLTEPLELPLHGRLPQREYAKEELIALWRDLAERHALPFRGGVRLQRLLRAADGGFVVHTSAGEFAAHAVVLAVGRRGSPRRLGVPGEDLPHVAYGLEDAAAYRGVRAVVVGGGDSAVETALALAEQPGNDVTIVYRQEAFFRIRSKNRARLEAQVAAGRLAVELQSEVVGIHSDHVEIRSVSPAAAAAQQTPAVATALAADFVFVLAGGEPPFPLLAQCGVSFDPALRPAPAAPAGDAGDRGAGLWPALAAGLLLAAVTLGFALWHADYYGLSAIERAGDPKHALLSPDRALGLGFGFAATAAVLLNLAYVLRSRQWLGLRFGSLAGWMTTHVGAGVLAVLLTMLHAAMSPRDTPGGHAFWALVALLVTGAVGRWFYAWLPRATNGSELGLVEVRERLDRAAAATGDAAFGRLARATLQELLERRQWRSSWLGRVVALLGLQWDLWRTLRSLRAAGLAAGVPLAQLAALLGSARQAHAAAVAVSHLEDLRAVLGTWRWLHRWLALLMVLLLGTHVVVALLHGVFAGGGAS
jgi:thioredoxin reductase/ferredoxin